VKTRTRLTTPPGQDPIGTTQQRPEDEHYVPALHLPEEPRIPGRHRRTWNALVIVLVLVLAGYAIFRVATAGQGFDPALDRVPDEQQAPIDGDEDGLPGED
jgi:hypothetical protein